MGDMVDNARKIVLTVQIPVFADADTGYGDAISRHDTVREYIQAGIDGAHIEDQTFPPKSGPRRRCISIQEMVGKLRAAMDAKQALDPDFVIMARCDLGGVPGASFAEIIERCQAYKADAQVDRRLSMGFAPENLVRSRLLAGAKGIRTGGPTSSGAWRHDLRAAPGQCSGDQRSRTGATVPATGFTIPRNQVHLVLLPGAVKLVVSRRPVGKVGKRTAFSPACP